MQSCPPQSFDIPSDQGEAIKIILRLLAGKSAGLYAHSVYTAIVAKDLAILADLSAQAVRDTFCSALLHDIGKLSIADTLLLKDSSLSAEEYDLLKTHAEKGAAILAGTQAFHAIGSYILLHHELPAGQGYPHNLSAADLPVPVRIVSIADKFSAMTMARPYRPAHTVANAVDHLGHEVIRPFFPECSSIMAEHLSQVSVSSIMIDCMAVLHNLDSLFARDVFLSLSLPREGAFCELGCAQ